MSRPVPKWLIAWGDKCIEALGLGEWDIRYTLQRSIGDDDRLGRASIQYEYEDADIFFRDDIKPDRDGYTLVMHELLHLANQHSELAALNIIKLLPDDLQPHAEAIWAQGKELDIVHKSRALTRTLRPTE